MNVDRISGESDFFIQNMQVVDNFLQIVIARLQCICQCIPSILAGSVSSFEIASELRLVEQHPRITIFLRVAKNQKRANTSKAKLIVFTL